MEQWKPVSGYEDHYKVSNIGRIKRFGADRMGRKRNTMLRFADLKGYARCVLCVDAVTRTFSVHRLVWAAFEGPIPDDMQINHKNGVKDDNRLENLEVVTASENKLHSIHVLGKWPSRKSKSRGETNGRAKITFEEAGEIRRRYAAGGVSQQRLADEYGIHQTGISAIIRNTGWLTES